MTDFMLVKLLRYGLNVPVITVVIIAASLLLFRVSSLDDVCADYRAMGTELDATWTSVESYSLKSSIDTLARSAKNYSEDSDIQDDGVELARVHDQEEFTLPEIAAATSHIATSCGVVEDRD